MQLLKRKSDNYIYASLKDGKIVDGNVFDGDKLRFGGIKTDIEIEDYDGELPEDLEEISSIYKIDGTELKKQF